MPLQPPPPANGHVTQRRFCSSTNGITNGGTNGGANGNGTNGHGTNGLAGNHAGYNGSSLYGGGGGGDYDNGTGSRTNLLLVSESKLMFVFLRMHKMSPAELSLPLKGAFHKLLSNLLAAKGLKHLLFYFLPEINSASRLNLNTCHGCKDKYEVQIKEIRNKKIVV